VPGCTNYGLHLHLLCQELLEAWRSHRISNLDYLLRLNTLAGRARTPLTTCRAFSTTYSACTLQRPQAAVLYLLLTTYHLLLTTYYLLLCADYIYSAYYTGCT